MEKGERFSEYLFAKMGPGDGGPKTTEDRNAPFEPTGVRKWIIDNTMLVITLIGVLTGIGVGKKYFRKLFQSLIMIFDSLVSEPLINHRTRYRVTN
jgi:hypothetical protein